ncbi:speckle-type POZ protein-like [Daphnia magna]|uniref:speckle-type POZ protein-like n=1 Tax=Daphnia magna TaxID=35525 RepID=UPI001E1BB2EE|nr:speckle-type POZ protein-like [Daphnia magna]
MNRSAEKSFTTQLEETFIPLFADNWCQTLSEVTTTDFKWNIPFPFLGYPPPSMKSSRFSSGDFCFWTLDLQQASLKDQVNIMLEYHPGANNTITGGSAQVITRIQNKQRDIFPTKTVVIVSDGLGSFNRHEVSRFFKTNFPKSVFYEEEGNVTIYCTVKMWTLKENKSRTSSSKIASDVCHNELVLTQLEELFKNKSLSDVKLIVGGRTLHAHKIILSARSKVFTAMFENETAEKLSNKVDIRDIDPDVFHEVLGYMYTGRMSSGTLEKMAVGVLAVADKYLLDQLKAECETHLINSMSADNCAELLALSAQPHPAMHLKKYAFDFLRRYPSLVMATDGGKKAKEEKLLWWYESIEMLCSQRVLDAEH